MRVRVSRVVGLTVLLSLLLVAPASAYIDPGSTTVVFQAVVAGVAAAGLSLKVFWSRIIAFFRRDSDVEETPTDDAVDESATTGA